MTDPRARLIAMLRNWRDTFKLFGPTPFVDDLDEYIAWLQCDGQHEPIDYGARNLAREFK